MDLKPATIRVHIDELIVSGVPAGDRDALGDAIRGELARLLTAHPWPRELAANRRVEALDAGMVRIASPTADALGRQVAHVVQRSLNRGSVCK